MRMRAAWACFDRVAGRLLGLDNSKYEWAVLEHRRRLREVGAGGARVAGRLRTWRRVTGRQRCGQERRASGAVPAVVEGHGQPRAAPGRHRVRRHCAGDPAAKTLGRQAGACSFPGLTHTAQAIAGASPPCALHRRRRPSWASKARTAMAQRPWRAAAVAAGRGTRRRAGRRGAGGVVTEREKGRGAPGSQQTRLRCWQGCPAARSGD